MARRFIALIAAVCDEKGRVGQGIERIRPSPKFTAHRLICHEFCSRMRRITMEIIRASLGGFSTSFAYDVAAKIVIAVVQRDRFFGKPDDAIGAARE